MLNRNMKVFQTLIYTIMVLTITLTFVMFIPILPVLWLMSFVVIFMIMRSVFLS